MEAAIFWIFAGLAVVASLVVVAHKSPIYATLSLVVTLFSVAVLFVLLGAPFLGVLQILVYAGAIVVLFLFVIMLLNVGREEAGYSAMAGRGQRIFAFAGGVLLAGLLIVLLITRSPVEAGPLTKDFVALRTLARTLFSAYLLPFEIVGLLLLIAVVGATVAARRPAADEPEGEP